MPRREKTLSTSSESLHCLKDGSTRRLSIKVKKVWVSLYRAVDSEGNTLEFLPRSSRDAEAAKHFFVKALGVSVSSVPHSDIFEEKATQPTPQTARSLPRVINVDRNAAYPKAIAELKFSGILPASVELRQVKYLNNRIEQDHRFIKRLTKQGGVQQHHRPDTSLRVVEDPGEDERPIMTKTRNTMKGCSVPMNPLPA
jgi:hypothetical protein